VSEKVIKLVKRCLLCPAIVLAASLSGCVGPRLVGFPYDPGGRSLNSPFAELNPAIAGRYIVFTSDRRGSQDVYLYDTVERRLIDLPGLNAIDTITSHPVISENGRFIVFAATQQERSGIYLYDRDTRQLRNLTNNLRAEVRNPTITADGNVIAFESSANGQWDILLYNRSGQPLQNVQTDPQ
jgi:beta propeller repeat protein